MKRIAEMMLAVLVACLLPVLRRRPRRVVLYYHGIPENQSDSFERQMTHLAANYRVVPASQIRTMPAQKGESLVAVTFDDALVSVWTRGVPVLKRLGLPATICVPTGNLGRVPAWGTADSNVDQSDRVMTENQVTYLDRQGFELFTHGKSHAPLSQLTTADLRAELAESKRCLEDIVGHDVVGIGYPHGAYDDRVIRFSREAGYRIGLTIQPGFADEATDELQIGRTVVAAGDSLFCFRLKACGAYWGTSYLRRCKRLLLGRRERIESEAQSLPAGAGMDRSSLGPLVGCESSHAERESGEEVRAGRKK